MSTTPSSSRDVSGGYRADWFDNPHLAHGGTYGVRGPKGLVIATNPFEAGWKKAQQLAAEMNGGTCSNYTARVWSPTSPQPGDDRCVNCGRGLDEHASDGSPRAAS